jgi:hypothetical protein
LSALFYVSGCAGIQVAGDVQARERLCRQDIHVGELYAATAGIGFMITVAGATFQTDKVFVVRPDLCHNRNDCYGVIN